LECSLGSYLLNYFSRLFKWPKWLTENTLSNFSRLMHTEFIFFPSSHIT